MNFKFDLQLFATAVDWSGGIDLAAAEVYTAGYSTLYINAAGKATITNTPGTDVATVTLKNKVTTAPTITDVKSVDFNANAGAGDTMKLNTNVSYSVTDSQGVVAFTLGTGVFTATSFTTTSAGELSKGDLTAVTTAGLKLASFTGTMINTTDGSCSFSGVTGTMGASGANLLTAFTKGTVTTNSDFKASGAIMGATVVGKSTITTNDNGDSYKLELKGTAQDVTLTGATKPFNVVGSAGADDINGAGALAAATVDGGAGADNITVAGGAAVSINGGAGNDSIYGATSIVADSSILGGAGKDTINFSNTTAASANIYFDAGGDDDFIRLDDPTAKTGTFKNSTVKGGAGKDTIYSGDASNLLYGGNGADVFALDAATSLSANIQDYKFGEDMLAVGGAGVVAIANAYTTAGDLSSDGKTGFIKSVGANGAATLTSSDGYFAVTMVDAGQTKANVGWVGAESTKIDAASQNISTVLYGTTNTEGDTLIGGSKGDTIYAGASDSIYGGAGVDSLVVGGAAGVFVGISSTSGADDVNGFTAGWDLATADSVYLVDGTAENVKIENAAGTITVKNGSASLNFTTAVAVDANGETDLLVSGKKVAAITNGGKAVVDDNSTIADYYVGTTASGIDMTNYTGNVEVNLGNEMFRNITTLQAGKGNMSVLGGKAAESLVGGDGETSLYGGAGKDTLKSGNGKTTFFANESSGKDVVVDFAIGTADNSDVININNLKGISRSSDTEFTVDLDGTNSLTVTQASGDINSNIQWASGDAKGVVKIGKTSTDNTFTYNSNTTNYVGSTRNDVVSVTSGSTDSFTVWLDQTGDMFNSIEVYDFSQTSGDVLAAGKANTKETIVAGSGTSSLWGGTGATKDVLINNNSSATAEFFYGMGDGNDEIYGQSGDSVNLYNLKVSDITKATINSNNVVFTTSANETVTVSGSVGTFKLADGTAWTANYSSKTWSEAQ